MKKFTSTPSPRHSNQSELFYLMNEVFPFIGEPTTSHIVIPLHVTKQGGYHQKYPCFGRIIIDENASKEIYNDHIIVRSKVIATPWFASVIRRPKDTFPYGPLTHTLKSDDDSVQIDMIFICPEGFWMIKVMPEIFEKVLERLRILKSPSIKDCPPVPQGGQYFDPKDFR